MKKLALVMIAVWSFIGLAVIAVIIFFTIFSVNDKGVSFTQMIFEKNDTSDMQIVSQEVVPADGIKTVELELFSDECNIYFTDSENIEMIHYARNVPQGQYAKTKVFGGTLHISTKPQGVGGFSPFSIMSRSTVDILLPETYKEALSISLMSGSLRFYGDAKLNELAVKISSGTIRSEHAVEVRDLGITVTSGSIKLTGGVKADNYSLKTSSGNITISEHFSGSGSVNVTSGTVRLAGVDITESLSVKASSGSIHIGISGNPGLQFSGKKSSGTVRTYFDHSNDGNTFSATVGAAPYKNLDVQVTSGTVRIIQD